MKEMKHNVLDKKEERIVEIFSKIGLRQQVAESMVFIARSGKCMTKDIEQGTGRCQPVVSIATVELFEKGWISRVIVPKPYGKGRPSYLFSAAKTLPEIANILEKEKREYLKNTEQKMGELKALFLPSADQEV